MGVGGKEFWKFSLLCGISDSAGKRKWVIIAHWKSGAERHPWSVDSIRVSWRSSSSSSSPPSSSSSSSLVVHYGNDSCSMHPFFLLLLLSFLPSFLLSSLFPASFHTLGCNHHIYLIVVSGNCLHYERQEDVKMEDGMGWDGTYQPFCNLVGLHRPLSMSRSSSASFNSELEEFFFFFSSSSSFGCPLWQQLACTLFPFFFFCLFSSTSRGQSSPHLEFLIGVSGNCLHYGRRIRRWRMGWDGTYQPFGNLFGISLSLSLWGSSSSSTFLGLFTTVATRMQTFPPPPPPPPSLFLSVYFAPIITAFDFY